MKTSLKLAVTLIVTALSFSIYSCGNQATTEQEEMPADMKPQEPTQEELIALGEYKVTTMGCHDCHSPKIMTPEGPMPDPERLLSGHPADETLPASDPKLTAPGAWILMNQSITAFVGPWGTSYARNLTSDPSGLGNWTEENFKIAITEGWYKGIRDGRRLLPPMPWPNMRNLSDEDVHAMFVYLQSTKPISNMVPEPLPPAGS